MSIRLIFSRHWSESTGFSEDVSFETVLVDCPEIENRLKRGGRGDGYDYTKLLGAEIVLEEEERSRGVEE